MMKYAMYQFSKTNVNIMYHKHIPIKKYYEGYFILDLKQAKAYNFQK